VSARGESSRWLDHATVAVHRASAVVSQLMHTVRPGTSSLGPVDIWEVLEETSQLVCETFDRRISLQLRRSNAIPAVLGESFLMSQIFLNVLLNARDAVLQREDSAGPGFAPEIRVSAGAAVVSDGPEGEARSIVRVVISDNGVGMSPEVLDRLFDPFFTTKQAGAGSGLGMPMVQSVIRELDGTIDVTSTPGVGTTVTIEFGAATGEPGDWSTSEDVSVTTPVGSCVLVIDDEKSVREIASAALAQRGVTVCVASDGEEGIESLRVHGHTCDLVLLNLNMPEMHGWDVLERLQALRPTLPVLIMSGSAVAGEALQRGAAGVLPKPFSIGKLVQAVDPYVSRPNGPAAVSAPPAG